MGDDDESEQPFERTVPLEQRAPKRKNALPFDGTPARRSAPTLATPAREGLRQEACELTWFCSATVPRARKHRDWRVLLTELEHAEPDPELDDPALSVDAAESEARRQIFHILAQGRATPLAELGTAVTGAVRRDGKLVPPLLLVAGMLTPSFDAAAALRAAIGVAAPFEPGDKALIGAIEAAKELLAIPDMPPGVPLYEVLSKRLRDAFLGGKRPVPREYFDDQLRRSLLEARSYQKRDVLGAPHVRALLAAPETDPVVVYLPAEVARLLPMAPSFAVRALAIAHVQLDAFEPGVLALELRALARTVTLTRLVPRQD